MSSRSLTDFTEFLIKVRHYSPGTAKTYASAVRTLLKRRVASRTIPLDILEEFKPGSRATYSGAWAHYNAWAAMGNAGVPLNHQAIEAALIDGHVPDKWLQAAVQLHCQVLEHLLVIAVKGKTPRWADVATAATHGNPRKDVLIAYEEAWPWLQASHKRHGYLDLPDYVPFRVDDPVLLYVGGELTRHTKKPWLVTWNMLFPLRNKGLLSHGFGGTAHDPSVRLMASAMWNLAQRHPGTKITHMETFLVGGPQLVIVHPDGSLLSLREWDALIEATAEKIPKVYEPPSPEVMKWLIVEKSEPVFDMGSLDADGSEVADV